MIRTTPPTPSSAVTIEQQFNADKEIKMMIQELVSVMYKPVKMTEIIETVDASCQTTILTSTSVGCQSGYTCYPCGLSYANSGGLRRHMRSVHESLRYVCVVCDEIFIRPATLRAHVLRTHADALTGDMNDG